MKINIALVGFIMFMATPFCSSAQVERLNEFHYLVVPERFDFQFEQDQYQLNSLLKFLFNKHGFNAYFENELPNVRRCDGLYLRLDQQPGFIWTELTIRLVDCDGILFYQTKTGKSKFKQYDKAYSQAIRMAFESIEILGVRQKSLVASGLSEAVDATNNETDTDQELEVSVSSSKNDFPALYPAESYLVFQRQKEQYVLRKTNLGHQLYHEVGADLIFEGKLFQVDATLFFEDLNGQRYLAKFDSSGDLQLEREGMKITYERQDQ